MNLNENLPENIKGLLCALSTEQAVPLGIVGVLPFLAVKTADEKMIEEGGLSCELKASILNVDYKEKTIGLCFVQLRLNASDRFIYTAVYDLSSAKQYADCYDLLGMKQYGLLVATQRVHDFLSFESDFVAGFHPRAVLSYAQKASSDYGAELFAEVAFALRSQAASAQDFWDYLELLAPYDKEWYGRMQMNKV